MGKSIRLLSANFGSVSADEATTKIYEQLTFYRDSVKSYVPHTPMDKLIPDIEARKKLGQTRDGVSPNREKNKADAERKAMARVKDYAKWNQFELFATFTFEANRQDVAKCFAKITSWFKNEQWRKGKIEYLIVPEYHKDEQSLHFHALMKNYAGEVRPAISPKTGRQVRHKRRLVYFFPSYTSGYSNVKKIKDTPEDHAIIGNYVSKYLTKAIAMFPGKQRYRVSKGLKLPPKQDNPPVGWNDGLELVWSKTNEYGTTNIYREPKKAED